MAGGGGGFRGPRGMMGGGGGGGAGAGNFKMMSMRGRRISVGGGAGGVATTNSPTSPASKPSSRCTSPTRAHHQKPLTSSSNNGGFSSGYGLESPLSPYYGWPAGFAGEEYEWVLSGGGSEEEEDEEVEIHDVSEEEGFLGPVPSAEEVHSAFSALTQAFGTSSYSQMVKDKYAYSADAMDQISSPIGMLRRVALVGEESDWLEPSPNLCNTRMSQSSRSDRVYDAFHMLQTDPTVQKMVISLSSDRAVWDAVLNNEAVRELRQTYSSDVNGSPPSLEGSDESAGKANPALNVVVWMLNSTRAKFADIFETLSKLVNDLLKTPEEAEKDTEPPEPDQPNEFDKIMRTSFHLSIIVLLLVVMTRGLGKPLP